MSRIAIDPITRVGGHLRVEVEIADGVVSDAWSSGTMFRGMERILKGRDPRDAWLFAQRICGACTGAHALASVRAVESALGVAIPTNARLIRNIVAGAAATQDHVVQFYQQSSLDWVDVLAALDADPLATSRLAQSLSDWPDSSAVHFKEVQDRLAKYVDSGQLGPFANGYWGHPAYRLPPEADLLVMAHYFEALDWQRRVSRIHALLGGKNPHPQTFLVGGMALAPPWGGPVRALPGEHPRLPERTSPIALSADGLADLTALIADTTAFVNRVYAPDVLAIAGYHDDWIEIGRSIGNYMSAGEFPEGDTAESPRLLPAGRIINGNLERLEPVDQAAVAETVAHSWYTYDDGDDAALRHPLDGQTNQRYAGPSLPFTTLDGSEKYSWLKAPRYQESPMEVGPLARTLVAYGWGNQEIRTTVDDYVGRLGLGPEALFGTLGRMVARAVEAQVVAARLGGWLTELRGNLASGNLAIADITKWDTGSWPSEALGWSFVETPRGMLGHWLKMKDQRIEGYQIVDATTWNASPRDAKNRRGPLEEALVGTPVADPAQPLEILRTVHSFAPCTACAVHSYSLGASEPFGIDIVEGGVR
jgi:hydrogenase large subunit